MGLWRHARTRRRPMSANDPKVRRFLSRAMVVRIATVGRSGQPHLTPLWFVREGNNICMNCRAESPAARDLATNANVVLLFEAQSRGRSARVLRIRGRAEFRKGVTASMVARSALKYHFSPGGLRNLLESLTQLPMKARYYGERAGEGGTIRVTPESAEFLVKPQA